MNIAREIAGLGPFEHRELARLDDRVVGLFKAPADSWIWERHPDGDELLHVVEGRLEMTLLEDGGRSTALVGAGELFLVPRGVWHRPRAVDDVTILFVTPKVSVTSQAEDPTRDPQTRQDSL